MRVTDEKKEKGKQRIFEETLSEHFPNLMKNINLYIQEAQQIPSRTNSVRSILRQITVKLSKLKKKGSS